MRVRYGSFFLPLAAMTTKSAWSPACNRPSWPSQPSACAGLQVTMAQMSWSEKAPPSPTLLWRSAILSSPSTLFDPDGDQSAPRHTISPALAPATTSVVLPYSHRLEKGDHTIAPPFAVA